MNKPENWPIKVMLGGGALLVGLGDMTFGTFVSPGVLALVGVMLVVEGLGQRPTDRDK